jgi:hypothetical protein
MENILRESSHKIIQHKVPNLTLGYGIHVFVILLEKQIHLLSLFGNKYPQISLKSKFIIDHKQNSDTYFRTEGVSYKRAFSCYGYSKNAVTKMQFHNFTTSRLPCEL